MKLNSLKSVKNKNNTIFIFYKDQFQFYPRKDTKANSNNSHSLIRKLIS